MGRVVFEIKEVKREIKEVKREIKELKCIMKEVKTHLNCVEQRTGILVEEEGAYDGIADVWLLL